MEIPKHIPPGHEILCGCMHVQKEHKGADAEELGTGPCTKCACKAFHFEGMAQLTVDNPNYQRATQAPSLVPQRPAPKTWWQRSIFRALLRNMLGITQDSEAGTLFMQIAGSNITQLTRLVQGLRRDIDTGNLAQNPVNEVVGEIARRLSFYEQEIGTGLALSYKKLMANDKRAREEKERAAAAAELDAANKRIEERKHKLEIGECIDCPSCEGRGDGPTGSQCDVCGGSGVVPNPEYVPPQPESDHDENGVKRHLALEE